MARKRFFDQGMQKFVDGYRRFPNNVPVDLGSQPQKFAPLETQWTFCAPPGNADPTPYRLILNDATLAFVQAVNGVLTTAEAVRHLHANAATEPVPGKMIRVPDELRGVISEIGSVFVPDDREAFDARVDAIMVMAAMMKGKQP